MPECSPYLGVDLDFRGRSGQSHRHHLDYLLFDLGSK
jgi:hypothetical protein